MSRTAVTLMKAHSKAHLVARNMITSAAGFTLIELLVVAAIIGVLASLLLPTLDRTREKAKVTKCVSNLHQIGIGMALYTEDNTGKFPRRFVADPMQKSVGMVDIQFAVGGKDARLLGECYPSAECRPLYAYLKKSEIFRCAADKGQVMCKCVHGPAKFKPTNWESTGCSYRYNVSIEPFTGNYSATKIKQADPSGIAGKPASWVPNPSGYILMHEPPAKRYTVGGTNWFTHWHYNKGPSDVPSQQLAQDSQRFVSPILFVDGHSASHDFTQTLKQSPEYPYEPQKDWVWYKPADQQ